MLSPAIIQEFEQLCGKENVQHSSASKLAYSYERTANFQSLPGLDRLASEYRGSIRNCEALSKT